MYKIVITKIETVRKRRSEYERIADTGNTRDNGAVYGHVEVEKEVTETKEILSQEVENLNLIEIIKAVNQIQ